MTLRKPARSYALDALRGLAILGMVFSGAFPHQAPWPAWMFHAQVGPPNFIYTPEVPGITWVDLVFPFFLFSMGAAFPLAMKKKLRTSRYDTLWSVVKRGGLLVFFAIVLRHTNPGFLKASLWVNYLTGIVVFVCFFLVFMRFNRENKARIFWLRMVGFGLIVLIIYLHDLFTPLKFNLYQQDIIILVLANMAVFGAVIWMLTRNNLMARLGVLAFFAAIWLTKDYENSYSSTIMAFHPKLHWFYQFGFLKYLNIIIPGTILGDLLLKSSEESYQQERQTKKKYLVFIGLALVLVNLFGLFTRQILFTFIASTILCGLGIWIVAQFKTGKEVLLKKLFYWGTFWLFLGLAFEPLAGGIKKDPSSFSYWFLTSGLAFFTYIVCEIITTYKPHNILFKYIIRAGQNPMVAYVAGGFVVLPILYFTRIFLALDQLIAVNSYLGIIKAIIVTLSVVFLTSYTVKKRWFWKT